MEVVFGGEDDSLVLRDALDLRNEQVSSQSQTAPRLVPYLVGPLPRQLDSRFDSLGTSVHEESHLKASQLAVEAAEQHVSQLVLAPIKSYSSNTHVSFLEKGPSELVWNALELRVSF